VPTETVPLCADEVINLLIICSAPVNILPAMASQLESKEDLKICLKRPFLSKTMKIQAKGLATPSVQDTSGVAQDVFDRVDLKQRTHALADFVAAAAQHCGFDSHKVFAVGYSNGANVASSLLLLRPGALRLALLFCVQLHQTHTFEEKTVQCLNAEPDNRAAVEVSGLCGYYTVVAMRQ
jgi:hypothetical protein